MPSQPRAFATSLGTTTSTRTSWDPDIRLTPEEGKAIIGRNRYEAVLKTQLKQVLWTSRATDRASPRTAASVYRDHDVHALHV